MLYFIYSYCSEVVYLGWHHLKHNFWDFLLPIWSVSSKKYPAGESCKDSHGFRRVSELSLELTHFSEVSKQVQKGTEFQKLFPSHCEVPRKRIYSYNSLLHPQTTAGFHIALLWKAKTKVIVQLLSQFVCMISKVLSPVFQSDPVLWIPFQRVFQKVFDSSYQ